MVAVIQQPNYFPWLGYLEQCARAESFVLLDSVQWLRRGWQHRARILPHHTGLDLSLGAPSIDMAPPLGPGYQWLTLPVQGHGHRAKPLRDLKLDRATRWHDKHWHALQAVYGKRPHFKTQLEPLVRPWLEQASCFEFFHDAARSSTELVLTALGIEPNFQSSTALASALTGEKTERLVAICRELGATTYYSGLGSTSYLDPQAFRAAEIRLVWQHWKHPEYDQGRARFRSHLSVLDALANVPLAELKRWLEPKPFGPFAGN